MNRMTRRDVLFGGGAAAAALLTSDPAIAASKNTGPFSAPSPLRRNRTALVLSGGGARGAYEAGIIEELARSGEIRDGQPLAPFGIVCGTSIGALNGWFVATGQYAKLRALWATIQSEDVIRLQRRFAKLTQSTSGVASRLSQAIRLALGLTKNVRGVADSAAIRNWMRNHVNLSDPVLLPLVWTVTNLSRATPEFFYRLPTNFQITDRTAVLDALTTTLGPNAVVREATDDILIDALFASAAIPVFFNPVQLPSPNGEDTDFYCDGGVVNNTPINFARTFAEDVRVIMLDPHRSVEPIANAVDVGLAVFAAMQRKILDAELHGIYLEGVGLSALNALSSKELHSLAMRDANGAARFVKFTQSLASSTLSIIQPTSTLPVSIQGFNRQDLINTTVARGIADAKLGWQPFGS